MLFTYAYVPHAMEKMQEFIDFIFHEVWCKAPDQGAFRFELFDSNLDLKEVMESFYYGDTQGGDFFYGHVESIYGLFKCLSQIEIDQLILWYEANNDIENVCANEPARQIARYSDIALLHPELGKQLASFFKGLYSQQLLDLAALRDKIGCIGEHYQAFVQNNTKGKCPFCGLRDIRGTHHTKREAYDHYLPKSLYPFNSINFRNLAPACHECNSTYKLQRDPAHNTLGRRKAFYPYSTGHHSIELSIDFDSPDFARLDPAAIQLSFGPATIQDEIETWREVYGIDERYRAKCCSESDGKYWLAQVLDEWTEDGCSPTDFLRTLERSTARNPVADCNFLKKAFLEGCSRAGLFDASS